MANVKQKRQAQESRAENRAMTIRSLPVTHRAGLGAACLTAIAGITPLGVAQSVNPDAIYTNGVIHTMAPPSSTTDATAQALAVYRGRILAIGSNEAVERYSGESTRRIDLNGQTVLPGLYAAHDHFPGSGIASLFSARLS